ncbi:PIR protein [Plasmodium ovale]|uniref:PIR Superfamily Protein n=2 Tax=Plasmodium ovale TaxID=36330 RepID=A0A1A8X9F3_PLAOA|nr:PIR Superfamily Protein [Plasmodium ovale curtisi]SBT83693.1 PIR protein [Plasmodium ovale]
MTYLITWYSGIHEVCYMFAKNLINLHEILSEEKDNDKRCIYFNFWITDHVRKKFNTQWEDKSKISSILTGFLTVEKFIAEESKNNNCQFNYNSNIDLELWKERKYLYDYIENYDDIKVIINSDGNLYNLCTSDRFNNKLQCDESNAVAATRTEDDNARDMGELDGSGMSHSVLPESIEPDIHTSGYLLSNNTDYYAKLGGSLTFMGILSTFLYLYKFTTFGTWIRSKIVKNKINVILDDEAQNSIAHELNNMHENLYSDGYNITYHSS